MNVNDPADPSNYLPHPMGYRCCDCNASSRIGVAVRHTSRCDIAPKTFVLPSDQQADTGTKSEREANTEAAKAERKRGRVRPDMRTVARDGSARLHYTDDEIVLAVRNGEITKSDAMNQDF